MLSAFFLPVVVIPRGFEGGLSTSPLTGMILGLAMVVTTTGIFETLDGSLNHSTIFLMGLAEGGLTAAMPAGSSRVDRDFGVTKVDEVGMMAKPLSETS